MVSALGYCSMYAAYISFTGLIPAITCNPGLLRDSTENKRKHKPPLGYRFSQSTKTSIPRSVTCWQVNLLRVQALLCVRPTPTSSATTPHLLKQGGKRYGFLSPSSPSSPSPSSSSSSTHLLPTPLLPSTLCSLPASPAPRPSSPPPLPSSAFARWFPTAGWHRLHGYRQQ